MATPRVTFDSVPEIRAFVLETVRHGVTDDAIFLAACARFGEARAKAVVEGIVQQLIDDGAMMDRGHGFVLQGYRQAAARSRATVAQISEAPTRRRPAQAASVSAQTEVEGEVMVNLWAVRLTLQRVWDGTKDGTATEEAMRRRDEIEKVLRDVQESITGTRLLPGEVVDAPVH